ncbi:hypothetical protein GGR54DRAFT_392384 [Hypoxylon sp. NC1633]|nr:hypothetical protein GGR54DRAFT_392384 [Hypoxylon sp. NC1633]
MSFGVGFGDLVLASKLAWSIYKACKDSGENFKRISNEVASLHVVLKETEDYISEFSELDTSRKNRLTILTDGCNATLQDLEKLLKTYERLGTQAQRTWDRMRFGLEDFADIRSRLVSSVTMLTAFNSSLTNSSTTRIEKRLNKFMCEVRAGYREGSVVTTADVAETIESPDVWAELRRELEDVGISPAVMEENHEYISNWMRSVLVQGLSEDPVGSTDALTPLDSGYGGSIVSSSVDMNTANDEFESEMRRKRADRPLEEVFKPLTVEVNVPSVRKKSLTDPSRLLRKLFVKEDALVQAASDGDIDKVARLLSIGCNVNARDRWGWSALSMCGYGGHVAIARLLLEHGADMYNVDVDGDTPMQLAATRGHSEVAILFDEAQAERDRLARELDTEPVAM